MVLSWLPNQTFLHLFQNDLQGLIKYCYDLYTNDLKNSHNPIQFENLKVLVNTRKFTCEEKFVTSGKNCNNRLFDCTNCPFLNKDEMFFHLASNRDQSIIPRLKSKYRNYQKSRVPGIFSKERLIHIKWIRAVIEEYQRTNNEDILYFENEIKSITKERIIYFWVKKESFIIVIGYNLWDAKQNNFYLKSAYIVDTDADRYKFKRLYYAYKKRQENNLGVL